MNPKEVLIELGFKLEPKLYEKIYEDYLLECEHASFRAHPVLCNKPNYITCGIVSEKDSSKVKAWYDFNTKESLEKFISNDNIKFITNIIIL